MIPPSYTWQRRTREGKLSNPRGARRAGCMHGENLRNPARDRRAGVMRQFPTGQVCSRANDTNMFDPGDRTHAPLLQTERKTAACTTRTNFQSWPHCIMHAPHRSRRCTSLLLLTMLLTSCKFDFSTRVYCTIV